MSGNFYDNKYYSKANPSDKIERIAKAKSPEQRFLESVFIPEPGKKLLDVGCGPGIILGMLGESGADLWGIDISKIAVEIAKKRVDKPGQIICANADPLPFNNEDFDYVLAWGVVEHFKEPFSILKEIRRVLKAGGITVIMVPNAYYYKFIWDTLRKGSGPAKLQDVEYLYSFREWKNLIEKAGLSVKTIARHNKFDKPRWAWLRNALIPFYYSHHFVFICTK